MIDEAFNEAMTCIDNAWSVSVHKTLETTLNTNRIIVSIGVHDTRYNTLNISMNKMTNGYWVSLTMDFYPERRDLVRYPDSNMVKNSVKMDTFYTMRMESDDRRRMSELLTKIEDVLEIRMPDEVWDYL